MPNAKTIQYDKKVLEVALVAKALDIHLDFKCWNLLVKKDTAKILI